MAEGVVELNDATFADFVAGDVPALIDFWAPWCGPCRMIAPMVEQLAAENPGKIVVGKINVDECQQVAANYGIASIPTLMFFKNGELVESIIGGRAKPELQEKIDALQ